MTRPLTLTLRFSKQELFLMRTCLDALAARRLRTGWRSLEFSNGADALDLENELSRSFDTARQKVESGRGATKRVGFALFELSAVMFSIRTVRRVPGRLQLKVTDLARQLLTKLHAKLEHYWKRAKRAFIRDQGSARFQELSRAWKRLLKWLRYRLSSRRLDAQQAGRSALWKLRTDMRLRLQEQVAEDLRGWRREVPPEKEFRALFNRAIRSARHRYGCWHPPTAPKYVREHVGTFIARRLPMPESAADCLLRLGIIQPDSFE